MLKWADNITSFYGSSCANNNGKGALNTPEMLQWVDRFVVHEPVTKAVISPLAAFGSAKEHSSFNVEPIARNERNPFQQRSANTKTETPQPSGLERVLRRLLDAYNNSTDHVKRLLLL
eukprot:1086056-Pyramimonas_sp.AAC.1